MELNDAVRQFLEEARFAVAATINRDGTPQQTVVWYSLQGDEIVMNTAKNRLKDMNLRRDPRMSVCVEDGYRYVTLKGSVRLDETNAQKDIEQIVARYEGADRARQMMRTQFSKEQRVTVRMRIEKVSGIGF